MTTTTEKGGTMPEATEEPTLLTAEQAAARLQVPKTWMWHAAREGLIPSVRCGRYVRFRPDDIEAWIASGGQAAS